MRCTRMNFRPDLKLLPHILHGLCRTLQPPSAFIRKVWVEFRGGGRNAFEMRSISYTRLTMWLYTKNLTQRPHALKCLTLCSYFLYENQTHRHPLADAHIVEGVVRMLLRICPTGGGYRPPVTQGGHHFLQLWWPRNSSASREGWAWFQVDRCQEGSHTLYQGNGVIEQCLYCHIGEKNQSMF